VMTETSAPPSIPITDLKVGTIAIREELHFTGGLRALRAQSGWVIGPVLRDGTLQFAGKFGEENIGGAGRSAGALLFGADEIGGADPNLPFRIWKPLLGPPVLKHAANDTWGMIASSARMANDKGYARLASNLSVSLRAASLQLRNASDEYHKQLRSALVSGRKVGVRFNNHPMIDLHLAFHSVAAEMASARDYLAQVAARRVSAPDNIDALGRLEGWLKKSANAASRNDDLIMRLLAASDAKASDPWLADITEYRNLFLDRDQIGAMAKWLCLQGNETTFGPVRTIRMEIDVRPGADATCDALTRFVMLYNQLCRLADFAAPLAPHAATPPNFVHSGS
jgi:hypothetical protein